jgi:shikimate kinase
VITRGPVLVLIGPPGVGKSTVGAMVARRLGVDFHDFDDDMQQAHGIGAGDLVVDLGRERFQLAERDLLARVLPNRSGVLALGGGTPTSPQCLQTCMWCFLMPTSNICSRETASRRTIHG